MKKLISLVLCLVMAFSIVAYAIPANAISYGYVRGDLDDNGLFNSKDVLYLKKHVAGVISARSKNAKAADVNGDGRINSQDVVRMKKIVAGVTDPEGNNTDHKYKVDKISINNKNISRFTIVKDAASTSCMNTAATTLKSYISKACGVSLNIATESQNIEGYKIKLVFDDENEYELGKEGYRIVVDKSGDLIVYCGSLRGPLYAVYFLLEEFVGYRFLFGGIEERRENEDDRHYSCVEYLYASSGVNIPGGYDETDVPAVKYRAVNQLGLSWGTYHKFRTNAQDGGGIAQAQYGWAEGTLYIHAHSYEYQCGITAQQQPCLTSDTTFEQIIDWCVNLINQREAGGQKFGQSWTQISCSPNDNTNFCKCSACSAVYKKEGSIAGTVFRLSNRVADYLDDIYPEIEI